MLINFIVGILSPDHAVHFKDIKIVFLYVMIEIYYHFIYQICLNNKVEKNIWGSSCRGVRRAESKQEKVSKPTV